MTVAPRIRRLSLTNFRSWRNASLAVEQAVVVLTGANGAGKTNLLESVSFLAPGRGLRRATLDLVGSRAGDGTWAVAAEVEGALGLATLGTGIPSPAGSGPLARKCRVDREPVGSAAVFADHLRLVWLVPSMDGLFLGPASERRRFLDRLVLTVHPSHGARVSALERALRSRNRLLDGPTPDPRWLDAVERETAELAVAVAAARAETMQRLAAALAADENGPFPTAGVALDGWMEAAALEQPAVELEDRYRAVLRDSRTRDAAAGRTLDGPHLTDLLVTYAPKDIPAREASTGEQKALLITLVLAHAGLVAAMSGIVPIMLLDEVVAHLDPGRRAALFDALRRLGGQVWLASADPAAVAAVGADADHFHIEPGSIQRA